MARSFCSLMLPSRAIYLLFVGLSLLQPAAATEAPPTAPDEAPKQDQVARQVLVPFSPARHKLDYRFAEDWYSSCGYGAPGNCANIGQPDYCCPSNCDCLWDSTGNIGCCPSGAQCGCDTCSQYQQPSYVPVTTYVPFTTWVPETTWLPQTTYVPAPSVYTTYAPPPVYTTYVPPPVVYTTYVPPSAVYTTVISTPPFYTTYHAVVPTSIVYTTADPVTVYQSQYVTAAGICSTLIADGPGLPTTRIGACGNILVIAAGNKSVLTWSAVSFWVIILALVHVGFGILWLRG